MAGTLWGRPVRLGDHIRGTHVRTFLYTVYTILGAFSLRNDQEVLASFAVLNGNALSQPEHLQERTAAVTAWAPGAAHLSSGEDCALAARDPSRGLQTPPPRQGSRCVPDPSGLQAPQDSAGSLLEMPLEAVGFALPSARGPLGIPRRLCLQLHVLLAKTEHRRVFLVGWRGCFYKQQRLPGMGPRWGPGFEPPSSARAFLGAL